MKSDDANGRYDRYSKEKTHNAHPRATCLGSGCLTSGHVSEAVHVFMFDSQR